MIEISVDQKTLKEINDVLMGFHQGPSVDDGPMNALEKMLESRGQGSSVNFDNYMSELQSESH